MVALRASTGQVVWYFQVMHDLWDDDVASQPMLVTVMRDGCDIPAVAVGTKMGHLFVLHREAGQPLFPVEERPVPPSTVPGEQAWHTQSFPTVPRPLVPQRLTAEDAWGQAPMTYIPAPITHEAVKQKGYTPPRKASTSHSHPLADYAGTYQHPAYSAVTITVDGTDLKATHNQKTVPLKHWHYNIFEASEWQGAKVTFFYNKQGDIDRLAVPIEPGVSDIVFTRMVDEAMRQRSVLEPFIGQYELESTTVTIALRGNDTLTFTALGELTYKLVPTRGTTFDIKGRNGFSVEFKQDAAGAVTDMVVYQPNGAPSWPKGNRTVGARCDRSPALGAS